MRQICKKEKRFWGNPKEKLLKLNTILCSSGGVLDALWSHSGAFAQ